MVEGPGATRNGRKVQPAVSLVVAQVEIAPQTVRKTIFSGRMLTEAFSVGKEVFLIFGPRNQVPREDDCPEDAMEVALRLHFGMNGCLYMRSVGEQSKVPSWRKQSDVSLRIILEPTNYVGSGKVIETVSSTSCAVSAFVARSKLSRLEERDVCTPNFNPDAVLGAIRERPSAIISDAILDQNKFPGVGNIIKIEGLHLACVNPKRTVDSLSDQDLRVVIQKCRSYAMGWLSSGRAPSKMVYNKTLCGTCEVGQVRMIKMGNDLSRVTFWCVDCQPERGPTLAEKRGPDPNNDNIEQCVPTKKLKTNGSAGDNFGKKFSSCPQHGSTLLLKRVRKTNSQNQNRIFWTCKMRQCQFFAWADSHLPSCSCGKKSILRVSKTERSGGQWFVCCNNGNDKAGRSKGCSLFSWAKTEQLAPLGNSITPLL